MGYLGLKVLIDSDAPVIVCGEPCIFQLEFTGVTHSPRCVKEQICPQSLAALQGGGYISPGVKFYGSHLLPETQRNSLLPHVVNELINDLPVEKVEQGRSPFHQGNVHVQNTEDRTIFHANDAASHDDHRFWDSFQLE